MKIPNSAKNIQVFFSDFLKKFLFLLWAEEVVGGGEAFAPLFKIILSHSKQTRAFAEGKWFVRLLHSPRLYQAFVAALFLLSTFTN